MSILLQLSDLQVLEIFADYRVVCYGHLLTYPINEHEPLDAKRAALGRWLERYEQGDGESDERQDAVQAASRYEPLALEYLVTKLKDDQHFQEPLFRMLNGMD